MRKGATQRYAKILKLILSYFERKRVKHSRVNTKTFVQSNILQLKYKSKDNAFLNMKKNYSFRS